MRAPIIVPATVPIPPAEREVPPMTAAAMDFFFGVDLIKLKRFTKKRSKDQLEKFESV